MSAYVFPLGADFAADEVGAKAWSLSRMLRAGLRVPAGFVVTRAAFDATLGEANARDIAHIVGALDPTDRAGLVRAAAEIRARVLAATLPEDLAREILTLDFAEHAARIAVRSSAIGESSREGSFAGQLDSILDVPAGEEVLDALVACWASCWSERALVWQRSRGTPLRGIGVVLQRMVPAKVAGVLFTKAPDGGASGTEQMLAEYCFGLGDGLVAGKVTPGRIRITSAPFAWTVEDEPEEPDEDAALFVTEEAVRELTELGARLEHDGGAPQDVEWAIDAAGSLWLLQSRPMTEEVAAPGAARADGVVSKDDGTRVRYSNAALRESYPAPASPLLYSVARTGYYHHFRNVGRAVGISEERLSRVEHPLRNIVGVHGGRMYYNLASIHEVLRVAPLGHQLVGYFDELVGVSAGRSDVAHTRGRAPLARASELFELVNVAVQTSRQFRDLGERIAQLEHTVDEFARDVHPRGLGEKRGHALLAHFRAFFRIQQHEWTNASLAETAVIVTGGILKRIVREVFPERHDSALSRELPDVDTPALELWELSRTIRMDSALVATFASGTASAILVELEASRARAAFHAYLEDWGFRGSGELMLTVPSFQENPEALIDVLRPYVSAEGASPREVLAAQTHEREQQLARVLGDMRRRPFVGGVPGPALAVAISALLAAAHASVGFRARARLKQALLHSRFRRLVLAVGALLVERGELDAAEDVFFLFHPEIDELLSGAAMFPYHVRELVRRRRLEHAELATMSPPDTVVLGEGAYLALDAAIRR